MKETDMHTSGMWSVYNPITVNKAGARCICFFHTKL